MTQPARIVLFALVGALASWLALARAPQETEHRATLYVFGTLVEIVIRDVDAATARRATDILEADFRRWHRDWRGWENDGELARLNAALARGDDFEASPELADLLRQAKMLSAQSGGLFEPGVGALAALWGFHADAPPVGPPPPRDAIAAIVRARPGIATLSIDGARISASSPALNIDLGGFAKGAALDKAAARLKDLGIENAVLNAGGDLNVLGAHGARPWRVAIRDPFGWGAVASLEARPGETVYTSGNYERFLEHDGERFSHIIDPRTGWPVKEIVSATVLDVNGARADAAATALSVAGPDQWRDVADAMGVRMALLIDASGAMHMTPQMRARLTIEKGWADAPVDVAGAENRQAQKPGAPTPRSFDGEKRS